MIDPMTVSLHAVEPHEIDVLAQMVVGLYAEDPGPLPMTPARALRQATHGNRTHGPRGIRTRGIPSGSNSGGSVQ